jgi:uncharacterized protein DUF748
VIVVLLLVALRVALPSIVRSQLESRTQAAVTGRLEVGDVDLWLVRGGLALKDVTFRADAAPDPPLVAFRRLYVNLGWLSLLRRTLRVEEFSLEGFGVHVERLADGALVLPAPRPAPAGAAPRPRAAPASPEKPWNVAVDHAELKEGRLALRDHVADPPEDAELVLDALALSGFTLEAGEDNQPGHGTIEAKFGDGTLRIETSVSTRPEGYALDAKIDANNVPLDRAQMHVPQLGWTGFAARFDTALTLHAEPAALPTASGTVALRDVRVDVGDAAPALSWRRLDIALDRVDPILRRAVVDRVALDGGSVLVTPRAATPLPLLPRRAEQSAEPAAEPKSEKPAPPWTWEVHTVEVTDTKATVVLQPPPLEITIVKATVKGLRSEPGTKSELALEVRQGDGTIAIDGTFGLDPLGARLRMRITGLAIPPLVTAAGGVPVRLPGGVLGTDLNIAADPAPLVVSGTVTLGDLAVALPEGEDFAAGWKRLEVVLRDVRVPGVLPADRGAKEPMRVDLDRVQLVGPTATVTRAPEGVVLPGATTAPGSAESQPAPPPAEAKGPGLALTVGSVAVEDGQVVILDRSVKPFYQGRVDKIGLQAHGLRVPENVFDDFAFKANLPGNAPLTVTGKQAKGQVQLQANGQRIPLAQFNPYVTQAAGYSIGRGAATFAIKTRWAASAYDSQNHIELDQLTVGGAQGDSLFLQRFGVPLTLALGLMRDVHGKIALDVPIRGDRTGGTRVDIGAVVSQALAHAIVNAISSPLKLLGALNLEGGKVADFAPEPIEFAPGKPTVADAGRERVDQLARVLASAPALTVELRGAAGPADVRALQEAAVLADLQGERRLIGGVRNLVSGGDRGAIRDAIAAGKTDGLAPDRRKTLDEWVAKKTVADDALHALAVARAEGLRASMAKDHGIDTARVTLGDPQVDRDAGKPVVAVALGAGS